MHTIAVFCTVLAVLSSPYADSPFLGVIPVHFFWAEADDPLLNAAGWEDPRLAKRYGRTEDDGTPDGALALTLYEQYLDERELTAYQEADVYAHMGLICMYGVEDRDAARARKYFKEALDRAGDEIISMDLYMARTNYAALIQDPTERFAAQMDMVAWMERMDTTAIQEALERRQPGLRTPFGDSLTEPSAIDEIPEAWRKQVLEQPHERTARLIRERMDAYMAIQLPETCVQAALLQPNPLEAMDRLIAHTEGTPIAERAAEEREHARLLQEAHERAAYERQGLAPPPPSE